MQTYRVHFTNVDGEKSCRAIDAPSAKDAVKAVFKEEQPGAELEHVEEVVDEEPIIVTPEDRAPVNTKALPEPIAGTIIQSLGGLAVLIGVLMGFRFAEQQAGMAQGFGEITGMGVGIDWFDVLLLPGFVVGLGVVIYALGLAISELQSIRIQLEDRGR